jgi:5,10-methylenetetrahydromethanopterin reductase
VVPPMRRAAVDAGRPETAVRVVAALPISVTDDPAAARARAAKQFAMYGQLPSYRAMLDREGYAGPEDAAIIGNERTVSERLDELRDAGVDEFVGGVFDPDPEGRARTRAVLLQHGER